MLSCSALEICHVTEHGLFFISCFNTKVSLVHALSAWQADTVEHFDLPNTRFRRQDANNEQFFSFINAFFASFRCLSLLSLSLPLWIVG